MHSRHDKHSKKNDNRENYRVKHKLLQNKPNGLISSSGHCSFDTNLHHL